MWIKSTSFNCMSKIYCVEFQRYPLKFHTKYPTHTLKDMILYNFETLRALRFKSSNAFLKRPPGCPCLRHYSDIIMGAMASQITRVPIVYATVCSDAYQSKHKSSASLAFVRGIHRSPMTPPPPPHTHKWPVTRKMFPFHDVIVAWYTFLLARILCLLW